MEQTAVASRRGAFAPLGPTARSVPAHPPARGISVEGGSRGPRLRSASDVQGARRADARDTRRARSTDADGGDGATDEATMRDAGNRDVTIRVIPGADHGLFVPSGLRTQWFEQRPVSGWVDEMAKWFCASRAGGEHRHCCALSHDPCSVV